MSTINAQNFGDGVSSVPTSAVLNGTAKATANLDGSGTISLRTSYNISSATDNGTGDYTFNISNAFLDNTYTTSGLAREDYTNSTAGSVIIYGSRFQPTTTSHRTGTIITTNGARLDAIEVTPQSFGDLA